MPYRVERDPLGRLRVPAGAYYGVQTMRAVENFPISGLTAYPELVTATVLVKKAAAEANAALGRLEPAIARAIVRAADEVLAGELRDAFVVDIYQAGAGTSHNMNANEVLANRAGEILGEPKGRYTRVHPNDHVNMGQSTNDVFPTATRLALLFALDAVMTSAGSLAEGLDAKRRAFASIVKTGRTHLQDAVPITLGQEFGGYAANVEHAAVDLARTAEQLYELNLGATAVGTGLNAGDDYTKAAIGNLAKYTRLPLRPAADRFRVTQSMGDSLAYSGALRRLAVEVGKIASDLRLLSMGPRAGLSEIQLPAVQPGSSIMPGKVNPSVPEMVNQVVYQVIGCDAAILAACDAGQLELNVMMPVIAWNALHASKILANAMRVLDAKCVRGIRADADRARELLDRSTAVATALSPYIGYEATAEIAKAAVKSGRPIRDIVRERRLIPDRTLDAILRPDAMTSPGIPGPAEPRGAGALRGQYKSATTPSSRRRTADGAGRPRVEPAASAARQAVSSRKPQSARRVGSGSVAAADGDHGRSRDRRRQRRR
jgi:aspartate ammonia-lyase